MAATSITAIRARCRATFAASIAPNRRAASSTLLADDFGQPNGLCFSLDEQQLFVNDTDRQHIRVFDVKPDGTLANSRVWAETTGEGAGAPDGMKIDSAGNIYCCGPGGIHVFDPRGHLPRRHPHAGIHREFLLRRRRPAQPVRDGLDLALSASRRERRARPNGPVQADKCRAYPMPNRPVR